MLVAAHPALHTQPASTTVQAQCLQLDAFPGPAPVSVQPVLQAQAPPAVPAQVASDASGSASVSAYERVIAAQLAHLASQHHASEYSKLKSGSKGPPVAYVPLSLQNPALVHVLRVHQAACAEKQQAWWPSDRESGSASDESQDVLLTPEDEVKPEGIPAVEVGSHEEEHVLPAMMLPPSSNIQKEISAAISSQIPCLPVPPLMHHSAKTSQTHPINVSMVIPFEILSAVASQLTRASKASPTMFRLPQSCYLDRVTAVAVPVAHRFTPFNRPANTPFLPPSRQGAAVSFHARPPVVWGQPEGGVLLQEALQGGFAFAPPGVPPPPLSQIPEKDAAPAPPPPFFVPSQALPGGLMTESPPVPVPAVLPQQNPLLIPAPPSPPTGVIRRAPRHERAMSAPPSLQLLRGTQRKSAKELNKGIPRNRSNPEVTAPFDASDVPPSVLDATSDGKTERDSSDPNARQGAFPSPLGVSFAQNTAHVGKRGLMLSTPASLSRPILEQRGTFLSSCIPDAPAPVQRLGNMFLSSCPGKKVRLSGPVKGRGAICRDLRADLSRVKNLGVGCIICCLNDTELDYLGASWSDYSQVANDLGLDVLRIPTPEGLAPPSPESVDTHLTRLIETYTLRGIPILAHCRGGVGRAGLIACCWMLKLGLCGWKDPDLCARTHDAGANMVPSSFSPLAGAAAQGASRPSTSSIDAPCTTDAALQTTAVPRVCRATVQLVERVITVVRRRRSLKAVETYEQVRFLVDFVEYLDARASIDCDLD
ncbi:hypothetical protein M0805_006325 [Coniferiporia weirii]|nr:hypothetical protein M0805_006325 [Coniferiporia weirii]